MKTNYLKLKSCSNLACETQTIASRDRELPSEFLSRVQAIARQWGRGNGSAAVEVSVENFSCGTVVSHHVVAIEQPAPKPEPVVEVEPVDEETLPVRLTLTKAHARIVLAALERRVKELDSLGGDQAEALRDETREVYQSIDKQVF